MDIGSKNLHYSIIDVFTKDPFNGNPLAIVEHDVHLSDQKLLDITREFGYSETVFIQSQWDSLLSGNSLRLPVRIFTPSEELSFAGHPSIGISAYIALRCQELSLRIDELTLVLPIGEVKASSKLISDRCSRSSITLPVMPSIEDVQITEQQLRDLSGLNTEELDFSLGPICGVSCGSNFLLIPVNGEEHLYNLQVSHSAWEDHLSGTTFNNLYFFCRKAGANNEFEVRMFGFGIGQAEDGGTGAAAAGLATYLRTFSGSSQSGVVLQGKALGRQSRIYFEMEADEQTVVIAGDAIMTAEGKLHL